MSGLLGLVNVKMSEDYENFLTKFVKELEVYQEIIRVHQETEVQVIGRADLYSAQKHHKKTIFMTFSRTFES